MAARRIGILFRPQAICFRTVSRTRLPAVAPFGPIPGRRLVQSGPSNASPYETRSTPSTAPPDPLLPVGAHPAVDSVVKNIMRDGKKARYERMVAEALRLLQLKTNQNPVELLTRALDMCAPLVKLMSTKRGARRIQVPRPLTERARRRFAVLWIKQAAEKKKGSFPVRFANEILLVLRGTSGALERRAFVHRTALQNRTNVR